MYRYPIYVKIVTVVGSLLLLSASVFASDIVIEPAAIQRSVGQYARVHVYADNATNLISMGVKVSFNPAVLQVADADKNTQFDTGFVMDEDGDPATTDDQYTTPDASWDNTAGTVTFLGGRLIGTATTGLSGKVLLGWIKFEVIGGGDTALHVDRAQYHPNHPNQTFDNFVELSGTVDEPANLPGDLGAVCVTDTPCYGDINQNGIVDPFDYAKFKTSYLKPFPHAAYDVNADFNGNGIVDPFDFSMFKTWYLKPCSTCPIP